VQLDFINEYAFKFMKMFDYYDLFVKMGATKIDDFSDNSDLKDNEFIKSFNNDSLKSSMLL